MEASKQEFFNWVLIQLVKLVRWRGYCLVTGECEVCPLLCVSKCVCNGGGEVDIVQKEV